MTDSQPQRTSALQRLQKMGAIFTGSDLTIQQGWTNKTASHYLWLWQKQGHIAGLGGHSDVFANLVVDRHPNWEAALLRALPSSIRMGTDCLRMYGWTTQIPSTPLVAIADDGPMYSVKHFDIQRRSNEWFDAVKPGVTREEMGGRSLPHLRPGWALAEMVRERIKDQDAWLIAPDDIDFSSVTPKDASDWRKACKAMDLPATPLNEDSYTALYGEISSSGSTDRPRQR